MSAVQQGPHLLLAPGLGTEPPLAPLVARLARRHRVAAHDPGLGLPAAVLAPAGTRRQRAWGAAPVAWWVTHAGAVTPPLPDAVRLLLVPGPLLDADPSVAGVAAEAGVALEAVPAPAVDGSELRPAVPFVRQRWRRRLGLPDELVVTVGVPGAPPLDEGTAVDALFLCAAAVVGPAHVRTALALGTPVVCDADTAAAAGATDGEHVRVAPPGEAAATVATELAADLRAAALLSRAGRRLAEARHDVAACARRVAAALGLPAYGPPPVARLAGTLEAMGTPLHAGIAGRVAGAVGSLGGTGAEIATRALRW